MRNKWPARFLTLRAPRHSTFPPLMSLSGQSASQETKSAAVGQRDMSGSDTKCVADLSPSNPNTGIR